MSSGASLGAGATVRLFYGLPVPREPARGLFEWASALFAGVRGVRTIEAEALHLTLAFLGSRPAEELPALRAALREAVQAGAPPVLTPSRYRETDRVAMIELLDESGRATALQSRLVERLELLGVHRRERRPWLPHVTVARLSRRPRLAPPLPDVPPFSPSDAALYHSDLRPDGAQYTIVEAVSLGG